MRIGAIVPNSGPDALRHGVAEMAMAAEAAGASSVWVSDHLVLSEAPQSDYPYSSDGRITWNVNDDYLESLTTCAYLAAATHQVAIGTAVLILPQRNVLQVAKEVATLDRLSGGRFRLGVGAGWNRAEMEALGFDFERRGARFDEMIDALRECWSGTTSGFVGDYVTIPSGLALYPTPTSKKGPPLLIGGMSKAAIRRAASRGDGWLALAFVDTWDGEGLARAAADFAVQVSQQRSSQPFRALKLHCRPESVDRLERHVAVAAELGFDEVIVELPWPRGIESATSVLATVVKRWE